MSDHARGSEELTRDESMRLLGGAPFGRVVFTQRALPTVRPVNHVLEGDDVIIRTHHGSALVPTTHDGVVVAYEADEIDAERRTGWSVIVVGRTEEVTDAAEVERFRLRLRPWAGGDKDFIIRIRTAFVTGYRLLGDAEDPRRAG